MKNIFERSAHQAELVRHKPVRSFISWLNQDERLIGLRGSRGVGKTTLMLQYANEFLDPEAFVYASLDNLYFSEHTLSDFADDFVKSGGKVLLLDEVHHYPNWSIEIKNIYDDYPELRIIFTGSSLLQLRKGRGDLSRRAVVYTLPGLSLREYIRFNEGIVFEKYSIEDIRNNHVAIAKEICKQIRPIKAFNEYLKTGYYPFFLENKINYQRKLHEVTLQILETDLPMIAGVNYANIHKLKQLLYIISESSPFKPNIEKLSARIGISKNTLKDYLLHMRDALLINLLYNQATGISRLTKPEKIYLHHPNFMYTIKGDDSGIGTARETFFYNQLGFAHEITNTKKGDFVIDGNYTFEIGGKNKTANQIEGIPNSFLALDGIEIGFRNEIPLWLFGFLY